MIRWETVGSASQRIKGVLDTGSQQQRPANERPLVLELKNVGLDIPILTTETRSLKSSLIRSVTGGSLKRRNGGAVVSALKEISITVNQGGRVALIGHNGAEVYIFALDIWVYQHTSGYFKAHVPVFPMIHKSFVTSSELSGMQAIKAHFLLVNGHLKGLKNL